MTPRDEMLELAKVARAPQSRNNGRVPYWMHVLSVAEILECAIDRGGEITDAAMREDIFLAALGHDLYEDTDVGRAEIERRFGVRVDGLIQGMTNDGDQDRAAYLARMGAAPEEVRLIKLAGVVDTPAPAKPRIGGPAPKEISEEAWERALARTRVREQKEAEQFGRLPPFPIPHEERA